MEEPRIWSDWPCCADCGRPRQTVCPTCGNAGNQFPLAEYQAIAEPQRGTRDTDHVTAATGAAQKRLLLCTRCDEAFEPQFYRICPACGAMAENGMEPESAVNEQISSRVLLAVYGLIALAALVLLYFWSLFRDH